MSSTSAPAPTFVAPRSSFAVLVFAVCGRRFALPLDAIEKVLPAVEVTPWPHVPPFVAGIIEVRGQVLPVIRAVELLNALPAPTPPEAGIASAASTNGAFANSASQTGASQPALTDHFVLLQYDDMRLVLWVERALEVARVDSSQHLSDSHNGLETLGERWTPIRISNDLTLLWNSQHLFDAPQTQALRALCATLGTRKVA